MTDAAVNPLKAGLEDVVVSPSEICFIDGHKGRLIYRGYDVDDLVAHSTFEEVTYLLWQGRLPSRKELDTHLKALASTVEPEAPAEAPRACSSCSPRRRPRWRCSGPACRRSPPSIRTRPTTAARRPCESRCA